VMSLCVSASAGALPKLAVMPLSGQRVSPQIVAVLDGLVTGEIDAARRFLVISASDMNAMIGFEKLKSAVGCDDVVCAAEIGGALGVDFLLAGSVSRLGDQIYVQLTLIDIRGSAVVRRGRGAVHDDENQYLHAVRLAVTDVLGLAPPAEVPGPAHAGTTSAATGGGPPVSAGSGGAALSTAGSHGSSTEPVKTKPVFRFNTTNSEHVYQVEFITQSGTSHRCAPVKYDATCLLDGLSPGMGRLLVNSPGLRSFTHNYEVDPTDDALVFDLREQPSVGAILMWSFGGIALATGVTLTAVGYGLNQGGYKVGGIPTGVVGACLLSAGFLFRDNVAVTYERLRPGNWFQRLFSVVPMNGGLMLLATVD